MNIPKLTPEQLEKAARALCKRKNLDPDALVPEPGLRLMSLRRVPTWTLYSAKIEDACDILAVLFDTLKP